MKIAMTGSSGLVGSALTPRLTAAGHQVVPMVRTPGQEGILWDPFRGITGPRRLRGIEAIVHLGGASIGEGRWTEGRKQTLVDSRVQGAKTLVEAALAEPDGPRIIVSASAIGFYGDRGDDIVDERSRRGQGFLADLCQQWESAFDPARDAGIRVANIRTGVVLSREGGALSRMLPPMKMGLGGPIGSGGQWMSWITPEDLSDIYRWALENPIEGPVNGVSPDPATNRDFVKCLGSLLRRPTILPLPSFAVKALFGEMGEELLLASTRVQPSVLKAAGFAFQHPDTRAGLRHALEK